jgi:opacity protein-like surface antigen
MGVMKATGGEMTGVRDPERHRAANRRGAAPILGALLALALSAGSTAIARAASAQQVDDGVTNPPPLEKRDRSYSRPGIYLSFAGGGLIETFDVPDAALIGLTQAAYIGGKIGSRHNRWIATETSVDYAVKGFEQDGTPYGYPGFTAEISPLYLSGNVKLFPFEGRFQPYVAGGIGGAWAFLEIRGGGGSVKETQGSFLGRVGGGLDVYLNENWALGPEIYWNITTGDLEALRTLSIGGYLSFRF